MLRLAAVAVVVLVPAIAAADPLELGAGVGLTQSKADSDAGGNALQAVGIYGRLHVGGPFAVQLELGRIQTADDQSSVRTATATGIIELTHGRLVPLVMGGVGVDDVSHMWGDEQYTHVEFGLGLSYRVSGGMTIGVDVREGTRSLRSDPAVYTNQGATPGDSLYTPMSIAAGDYRAAHVTVGIRF
jgi:hypothetical protein